jgi:hypothetical protein
VGEDERAGPDLLTRWPHGGHGEGTCAGPSEGDHGGVGGHDVFVGDPKSRALSRDTSQLCHPLLCVALPEGVFVNRIAHMHG